jgi:hypothetical protein
LIIKIKAKANIFVICVGKRFNGNKIIKLVKFENKERSKYCDLCSGCYKLLDEMMIKFKKEKGGEIIK